MMNQTTWLPEANPPIPISPFPSVGFSEAFPSLAPGTSADAPAVLEALKKAQLAPDRREAVDAGLRQVQDSTFRQLGDDVLAQLQGLGTGFQQSGEPVDDVSQRHKDLNRILSTGAGVAGEAANRYNDLRNAAEGTRLVDEGIVELERFTKLGLDDKANAFSRAMVIFNSRVDTGRLATADLNGVFGEIRKTLKATGIEGEEDLKTFENFIIKFKAQSLQNEEAAAAAEAMRRTLERAAKATDFFNDAVERLSKTFETAAGRIAAGMDNISSEVDQILTDSF